MHDTAIVSRASEHAFPQYPLHREALPTGVLRVGRYMLRFAASPEDLRSIQKLRFEVFNEELGEGLASSYATGLDEDEVDARCHHLMVLETGSQRVVGTYRVMLAEMAHGHGFYSEAEYDLATLPTAVKAQAVEAGRACVSATHRNGRVVQLLWRGLARYMTWNDRRYLFGCCSVPTIDPTEARGMHHLLERTGSMHDEIRVHPTRAYRCPDAEEGVVTESPELPPLFASYLKLGARVLSGPALDREFRVTDFFVLLDLQDVEPHVRRSFFDRGGFVGEKELTIAVA